MPGLQRVVDALGPGNARIVGGAVRDTLLGIDTADVDLATTHAPEQVVDLLEAAKIKAVPTGIKHGTITAVANDEVYEVTTLRRDLDTDGRHATVAFTDDWREDAARRDFTINALYADPASGEVFDYFGGIDDLEARRVRFIGDPLTRIAEDHLRILRFFRFLARFGDAPDPRRPERVHRPRQRPDGLVARTNRQRIAAPARRAARAGRRRADAGTRHLRARCCRRSAMRCGLATLARHESSRGHRARPDPPARRHAAARSAAVARGRRAAQTVERSSAAASKARCCRSTPSRVRWPIGWARKLAIDRLLLAGESVDAMLTRLDAAHACRSRAANSSRRA